MKVILLKELKGRGGEGDVIEVARGYANNYLLTQGYAIKATKGNLKQLEQRKKNIAKREEVRIANANELAEKLNDAKINVVAKVGEEGQLFGSVTSSMIVDAINSALDVEIDKHRVELRKPIKAVGEYPVEISIYRDIKATVNVVVVGEEVKAESEDESVAAAETAETAEESETAESAASAETPAEESDTTETSGDTQSVDEAVSDTEVQAEEKADDQTSGEQATDEADAVVAEQSIDEKEVPKEPEVSASESNEDEAESAFDEEIKTIDEEPDLPAPEEEPDLPAPDEEPDLPAPEKEPDLPAPEKEPDLPAPEQEPDLPASDDAESEDVSTAE